MSYGRISMGPISSMHDDHFSIPNTKQADSAMHTKSDGSLITKPGNENLAILDNPPRHRSLPRYACGFFDAEELASRRRKKHQKRGTEDLQGSNYGRRKKKVE
ncbi:hypothetical protein E1267_39350 [Nonomuraea longispora]|uniref:Uncharacterized protein n=1 Tax=Nonomuraea longispora TaxID=1848320 RepID=A0A4R4MPP5_9ACTN|nr:hypothetical protein [Nonomuraea longispora]TDB97887.1 hypothetical protein E1267_39350 [Nonomuraea longispora]